MKLVFISNYMNHHQQTLCCRLSSALGKGNFHFIATEPIDGERTAMGYADLNSSADHIVCSYESSAAHATALRLTADADAAIIGSSTDELTQARLSTGKLTMFYLERIFKQPWRRFDPRVVRAVRKQYVNPARNTGNIYLLSAGAYAAADLSLLGFPKERCLRWGYFPPVIGAGEELQRRAHNTVNLLWAGRMLDWKHPGDAPRLLDALVRHGVDARLTMIGEGACRAGAEALVRKLGHESRATFLDFMTPMEVRRLMLGSDIYVFSSGAGEGWGAVLGEAMNSGCCVVANSKAGATPYLVSDGVNGFVYDGSRRQLRRIADVIAADLSVIADTGRKACESISRDWSPEAAASRLLAVVGGILDGAPRYPASGPCSQHFKS